MALFVEKKPRSGGFPRQVKAVKVQTEAEYASELLDFLNPAWESVEILENPPRVKMSHGRRCFIAYEGQWIVNPYAGAYFPMREDHFTMMYEPVEAN